MELMTFGFVKREGAVGSERRQRRRLVPVQEMALEALEGRRGDAQRDGSRPPVAPAEQEREGAATARADTN